MLVMCYHPTSLKLKPLFFTHAKDRRVCNKLCVRFGSNMFTVLACNTLNIHSLNYGYPLEQPNPFTCQFIKVCCKSVFEGNLQSGPKVALGKLTEVKLS